MAVLIIVKKERWKSIRKPNRYVSRLASQMIFGVWLPHTFKIGTLIHADNADFFLSNQQNQRSSAFKKEFCKRLFLNSFFATESAENSEETLYKSL